MHLTMGILNSQILHRRSQHERLREQSTHHRRRREQRRQGCEIRHSGKLLLSMNMRGDFMSLPIAQVQIRRGLYSRFQIRAFNAQIRRHPSLKRSYIAPTKVRSITPGIATTFRQGWQRVHRRRILCVLLQHVVASWIITNSLGSWKMAMTRSTERRCYDAGR